LSASGYSSGFAAKHALMMRRLDDQFLQPSGYSAKDGAFEELQERFKA